ncbi:MAG: O-antigen ligase family protein [Bryobacteraceae bacterium]
MPGLQPAPLPTDIGVTTVLLGAFVLMYVVPIAEILIIYGHLHIPVVVIDGVLLTIALPLTGRIGEFWKSPLAKPWMATLVMMCLAAAAGTYPGRSVPFIFQYGVRFHVLPFYVAAIACTTRRVRHLMKWIAGGGVLLLLLCAAFGKVSLEDRFALARTSLSNPNDLAFSVVFAMASLTLLVFARSAAGKLLWFVTFPVCLYYILKTGSRANFVTLVVMGLVAFALSSRGVRALMLLVTPLLLLLVVPFIPHETLHRLTLIVSDPASARVERGLKSAVDSQAARTELQERAIELTLQHPVLGVGALMFEDAVEQMVRATLGVKSGWQGAHNTYLEISAENGIPALIFYAWSLGLCFVLNYRAYKVCKRDPSMAESLPQSLCLILTTVAFTVGVLFSNNAYDPHVDVLVAMTAANFLAIRSELAAAKLVAKSA